MFIEPSITLLHYYIITLFHYSDRIFQNNKNNLKFIKLKINWYEPQGKPWTLNSGASSGELTHTFLSADRVPPKL